MELKEIPVQILKLEPGDVLMLRCPEDWTDEQRFYLRAEMLDALHSSGRANVVAVIWAGIDLAVVKP